VTRIVLAGASGLVGGFVAKRLEGTDVVLHLITRRSLNPPIPRAVHHVGATETWAQQIGEIRPDVAISCLGTTMRQVGSQAAFSAVDHDLVIAFAQASFAAGARHMISVSSVGAAPDSRNFYLGTKGKTDNELGLIGFDTVDVLRPGLLRAERRGARRMGERIGILLSPFSDLLLHYRLRRYRSIAATEVADAICTLAMQDRSGFRAHENDSILKLARQWRQ
jgi:uncharacterized protein YbjT (DUF2867 family)